MLCQYKIKYLFCQHLRKNFGINKHLNITLENRMRQGSEEEKKACHFQEPEDVFRRAEAERVERQHIRIQLQLGRCVQRKYLNWSNPGTGQLDKILSEETLIIFPSVCVPIAYYYWADELFKALGLVLRKPEVLLCSLS